MNEHLRITIKCLPRKVISETGCQKMLPGNHQTSLPVLQQLPMGKWISIPATQGKTLKDFSKVSDALPRCHLTTLYLWKTEPTSICKENPAKTTPKNYNHVPQLLGLMNGPPGSQQRTSTPWAP